MMLQSSELNGRESKGQINTKKQYGTMSRWTVRHATERFPGPNGLQKPTCAGQTHQQGIGVHRGYRITMKTHREKPWKNRTFGGCFFPFNLFHKNCTSVHFWWAGQDLVVLSTLERPQHQAFSCLPKKSPTPSIPVGKSQLWTCPHHLPAQPSQQPGPQQSEIF